MFLHVQCIINCNLGETLSIIFSLPLGLMLITGATESIIYDLEATSVFPDESDAST